MASSSSADFDALPEECIANILSFTSPADVCRLSLVSSIFSSAANSDAVWERFLPSDYSFVLSQSTRFEQLVCLSNKQLYFSLCADPLIIDDGNKSFSLDKWSGKKCYMIAAKDLSINLGGSEPNMLIYNPSVLSRFKEIAFVLNVCCLEIIGKINTSILSLSTKYAAYLVLKVIIFKSSAQDQRVETSVMIGDDCRTQNVSLHCQEEEKDAKLYVHDRIETDEKHAMNTHEESTRRRGVNGKYAKERTDGLFEIEIGEFFGGGDYEVSMRVKEMDGGVWQHGCIIQGIDVRPIV